MEMGEAFFRIWVKLSGILLNNSWLLGLVIIVGATGLLWLISHLITQYAGKKSVPVLNVFVAAVILTVVTFFLFTGLSLMVKILLSVLVAIFSLKLLAIF
jgi:hypothetical protein